MSLLFEKRKDYILKCLAEKERVKVTELAEMLEVSGETIRRDLDKLEKEGLLKKVFGGAIKEKSESKELAILHRLEYQKKEKIAICKAAADLVEDGDTIMLGYGSTILLMAHFLKSKKNLTIITNSVPILNFAVENLDSTVIFAGGEISEYQQASIGKLAEQMIEYFKVNKTFISVSAVSSVEGLTDYDLHGASISRKMLERGEDAIVLADHSKFGKVAFAKICTLEKVSMFISDSKCSENWKNYMKQKGIELFIADEISK